MCQPLLQLIGVARIEALADEREQVVAQCLCQLLFGYTRDVCILDDVTRIDIDVVLSRSGFSCRPITKNTLACPSESMTLRTAAT